MEGGDPDAPTHKRPRLDSVNPVYNGLPPPQPPSAQPTRHPSHPTSAQASSPPPVRHRIPHTLPPPSHQPYPSPGQGHYPGPQPSPSLPPSDIHRTLPDPRNIPSPGQRTHGVAGTPVTLPARSIPQDNSSTYRPPAAPPISGPDLQGPRPASVGVDAKPPPPHSMEHGGHPGSWAPDPRHNGSISNGYNPGISPPNPHESPYNAPHQPGQHYVQPPSAYPAGPAPYMNQYAPTAAQIRRKQVRATQACNHCRSRKQKCDEARPCQFCRENNFDCQYKDVPPPKQDRSMMQLQDSVNNISDTLKTFVDGFNTWKQSVEDRLPPPRSADMLPIASNHASPEYTYVGRGSMSEHNASRMPTPIQGRTQLRRVNSMKRESPNVPQSNISPIPAHASTPIKQEIILAAPQPPATPADSVRTDHTQPSGDLSRDKTGLQSDHRTPAHCLLEEWPSMAHFALDVPEIARLVTAGKKISEYPMEQEQERGLLRVWGVGEGHDSNDGAHGPASPESSNEADAPSPASGREGIWGCPPVDHSSPSTMSGDTPRTQFSSAGGLGPDGKPDFTDKTLWDLHDSYHQNIHVMHPFLNPSKLRKMIKEFGEVYSPKGRADARAAHAMSPGSAVPDRLNPGIKRKRSSSAFGDGYFSAAEFSNGNIERSLRNAIVLLVLALGKVCRCKDPLPSPQGDKNPCTNGGSWGTTRDSPHSTTNSFSSEDTDNRQRNIDLLPGMAYFSYATDILGNQQGGNTVGHAQAMILAALYLGQYARVLESWSWINNACRICLVLIKADMSKITRDNYMKPTGTEPMTGKEQYRLNLVKCVYWTCLQLETDILAELSTLPPSEVSKYQESIMYPSGVFENFPEVYPNEDSSEHDMIMWIYSSQIHLRVILNAAHNTLYGSSDRNKQPGFDTNNIKDVAVHAKAHADILLSWRNLLPPVLAWSDDDPPSTDLNLARVRAKFYGGHYMILRPFLYMAVHSSALPPAMSSNTSSPAAAVQASTPTDSGGMRVMVDLTADQLNVLDIAYLCIESAVRSTVAFDRVGADPRKRYENFESQRTSRLILTNIFGTLHAQFGNMLVLASTYRSILRKYLPNNSPLTTANLRALFKRTIDILAETAPNSPILLTDLNILLNVRKQLSLD